MDKITYSLKSIFSNNKSAFTNLFSLGFIQVSNQLVALLSIPFLVRTLGIESYGIVILYQSITSYFSIVIGYSFSFLAINKIAITKDKKVHEQILNDIISTRLIITLVCLILLCIIASYNNQLSSINPFTSILYLLSFSLQVDWFFQGIQNNKKFAIFNLIGKIISFLWLFLMVKNDKNINEGLLFFSISNIVVASLSYFSLNKHNSYKFKFASLKSIFQNLKSGFGLFVSAILGYFYSADFNIAFLGLSGKNQGIGEFGIAYKVFLLSGAVGGIISANYIPKLAEVFAVSKTLYKKKFQEVLIIIFIVLSIISILTYLFADYIVWLINGKYDDVTSNFLKLLCLVIPLSSMGQLLNQIHILQNKYSNIIYIGLLLVISNLLIVYFSFILFGIHSLVYICIFIHILILFFHFLFIKYFYNVIAA